MMGLARRQDDALVQSLLQQQLQAVEAYERVDGDLADAEASLVDAQAALEEAQREFAEAQAAVEQWRQALDQAFDAWEQISSRLDDLGVEEQYLLESSLSDYGQTNYA